VVKGRFEAVVNVSSAVMSTASHDGSSVNSFLPTPEWTPGPVGDNVVIAWNGGREALRADAREIANDLNFGRRSGGD